MGILKFIYLGLEWNPSKKQYKPWPLFVIQFDTKRSKFSINDHTHNIEETDGWEVLERSHYHVPQKNLYLLSGMR